MKAVARTHALLMRSAAQATHTYCPAKNRQKVEGEDLLLMARDVFSEEETAVVKDKVDRGLVREEVSFAKLVADLARKQKCTVSSLKMMRGSVMETMTKDSHISITSSIFLRIYMPSLKTDAATEHCPRRVYPHWEDEDSHIWKMKIASLSNYPIMRAEARGLLGEGD